MVNKSLALLGATGSIGTSTFAVAAEQNIPIVLASADKNHLLLLKYAKQHNIPSLFFTGIEDPTLQTKLKAEILNTKYTLAKPSLLKHWLMKIMTLL